MAWFLCSPGGSRSLQGSTLGQIHVMIRSQVFHQVILARESIAAFARAVLDRAIAEDGEVYAGLMALQVCEAGEGPAAVIATEGLCGSERAMLAGLVQRVREKKLTWIEKIRSKNHQMIPLGGWAW